MKKLQLVLLMAIGMLLLCSCEKKEPSVDDPNQISVSDSAGEDNEPDGDEETDNEESDDEETDEILTDENGEPIVGEDGEDIVITTKKKIDDTKAMPDIIMTEIVNDDRYDIVVPQFSYPENPKAVNKINIGLANFEKAYQIVRKRQDKNGGKGTIDCRSYCFSNHNYVTAVVYWREIPDEASEGSVYSYVFDVQNGKFYNLRKALSNYEIKESEIKKKFESWYHGSNELDSVKVDTFRITTADNLEVYLTAKFKDSASKIFVYNHAADTFIPFSTDMLEAAELFENYTALVPFTVDSAKNYKVKDKEYSSAELISIADAEYMKAYCTAAYLFYGKGEYGKEQKNINGVKYYKSEREGFETYDEAMKSLKDLFLFPEEYFGEKIAQCLYKDEDGSLWIREEDTDVRECTATGVSAVDSVIESIMAFKVVNEIGGKRETGYFALMYTNDGSFKCTNFTYPE